MVIAVGCDHIVTEIKDQIVDYLRKKGHEVIDVGTYDKARTHYPIFGKKAAQQVVTGKADRAVVICGTGVGVTNAACKVPGTRAVLARDIETVRNARKEFDINVLGMGGRISGLGLIEMMVDTFLETPYVPTPENQALIRKIDALEPRNDELFREDFFAEFLEKWDRGEYHD